MIYVIILYREWMSTEQWCYHLHNRKTQFTIFLYVQEQCTAFVHNALHNTLLLHLWQSYLGQAHDLQMKIESRFGLQIHSNLVCRPWAWPVSDCHMCILNINAYPVSPWNVPFWNQLKNRDTLYNNLCNNRHTFAVVKPDLTAF